MKFPLWNLFKSDKSPEQQLRENTRTALTLNGVAYQRDVYIIGAGPGLADLASKEISFLNSQITIGVNRTQYLIDLKYFISAYPGEVLLARRWLSEKSQLINIRNVYEPPLVEGSLTLRKRPFDGVLPFALGAPNPTVYTYRNVCLAASHLALILGARRIIYLGIEQQNGLHYFDFLDDIKVTMRQELEACREFPYFTIDHPYAPPEKLLENLAISKNTLKGEKFGKQMNIPEDEIAKNMDHVKIFKEYFACLAGQNTSAMTVTKSGILNDAGYSNISLDVLMC